MSAATDVEAAEPLARRLARSGLTRAVRGRGGHGAPWGEALLGEFDDIESTGEAVMWAVSGLWFGWRQRLAYRRGGRAGAQAAPVWWKGRGLRLAVAGSAGLVAAGLAVNAFVLTAFHVPTESMRPVVEIDDRVLVDRLAYRAGGLGYGDVVMVRQRVGDAAVPTVRRVAGLPGDVMACRDGKLYRGGTAVGAGTCSQVTVPRDGLYLVGDAHEVALDSRRIGPAQAGDVVGRVVGRIWPPARVGTLGD